MQAIIKADVTVVGDRWDGPDNTIRDTLITFRTGDVVTVDDMEDRDGAGGVFCSMEEDLRPFLSFEGQCGYVPLVNLELKLI